ncbi:hypothetical protein [Curtobacterium sp. MCPF17_052]|uniref:hypothetical protein n=1 Tax=Curtobacterium sp. MCPF17_052 TaxID=2175655 RepID=UPI0024DF888D|nr:hypothetical protein [Curtobacterium sp. MCPF17_052]WIB11570.1 hypothetical protein DEJ36_11415 [Curtobacterium sp. MCPF17_052]
MEPGVLVAVEGRRRVRRVGTGRQRAHEQSHHPRVRQVRRDQALQEHDGAAASGRREQRRDPALVPPHHGDRDQALPGRELSLHHLLIDAGGFGHRSAVRPQRLTGSDQLDRDRGDVRTEPGLLQVVVDSRVVVDSGLGVERGVGVGVGVGVGLGVDLVGASGGAGIGGHRSLGSS